MNGLPLKGLKLVEFEGLGPGPLAGRMLAQAGAQVTLIARPTANAVSAQLGDGSTPLRDGKQVVLLDLKNAADLARALELVAGADALIEGNRPGVMERLGLGPEFCGKRNPRLVYGRMTGWGQHGPLALAAGHDMNYVALTGLMSLTERPGHPPMVPPTVVGDAAGALGFAFGMVSALLGVRSTGQGCVVDGAIVDVLAMLSPIAQLVRQGGGLEGTEPSVFHDSPFYDRYLCSDGRYVTVGAIEPQFYALLLTQLELTDVIPAQQMDKSLWPALKARIAQRFASQPSGHWNALMVGSDSCFAPVLTMAEAAAHPHNVARGLYSVTAQGDIETARGLRFLPLMLAEM